MASSDGAHSHARWSAGDLKGETDVDLVRGAVCPREGAAKLDRFMVASSGAAATRPTTVLASHDDANLYLKVTCGGQANPKAIERPHDGPVWEDDAVEIFLQPPGRRPTTTRGQCGGVSVRGEVPAREPGRGVELRVEG